MNVLTISNLRKLAKDAGVEKYTKLTKQQLTQQVRTAVSVDKLSEAINIRQNQLQQKERTKKTRQQTKVVDTRAINRLNNRTEVALEKVNQLKQQIQNFDLLVDEKFKKHQLHFLAKWVNRNRNNMNFDKLNTRLDNIIEAVQPNITLTRRERALDNTFQTYSITPKSTNDANSLLKQAKQSVINQIATDVQQNKTVKVYLTLQMKYRKVDHQDPDNIEETDGHHHSRNHTVLEITDLSETYDEMMQKLLEEVALWTVRKSGWQTVRVEKLDINIDKMRLLRGNSYIPLPKSIKAKKACVNVQNEDEMCFKWSILSALYPVDGKKHPDRLSNYNKIEHSLNFDGITFPVKLRDITKFEKKNPSLAINVFSLDDKENVYPIRIASKEGVAKKMGVINYFLSFIN